MGKYKRRLELAQSSAVVRVGRLRSGVGQKSVKAALFTYGRSAGAFFRLPLIRLRRPMERGVAITTWRRVISL